ncbi:hypothetical protein FACS189491_02330 [Spirochaetia bacterium]|nr:hypothetical protein FACS189491_02330 [Spirochaetia bacterium]
MDHQETCIRSAAGFNTRGRAYENKGEYARALEQYQKARELEPENADYETSVNRAMVLTAPDIRRGRSPLTLEAKAARIHSDRGDTFYEQQDYDSAIREYTRAIELDPITVYHAKRGNTFFKMEAWNKALADYLKVLETYPRNKEYQDRLAACEEKIAEPA